MDDNFAAMDFIERYFASMWVISPSRRKPLGSIVHWDGW